MNNGITTGLVRRQSAATAEADDRMPDTGSPVDDRENNFARCYNRCSFMFRHRLRGHPLFQISSLIEVARRQGDLPEYAYWSNGSVEVADRWEKGADDRRSLLDTIAGIAENDSLVMLRHAEQDPGLGPVLSQLLFRMVELSGDRMREDVIVGRATILIASPHRITTYHMDADTNFLFQLTGGKKFSVFNHTDRALVTEDELERYHAGDASGAVFKTERQNEARVFDLRAGFAVHVPSTAPHWAQNGDSVSVALSLNYDLRSIQRSAQIYALNRRLRRLGISPAPPGRSRWRDSVKLAAARTIGRMRHLSRRIPVAAPPPGWTPPAA